MLAKQPNSRSIRTTLFLSSRWTEKALSGKYRRRAFPMRNILLRDKEARMIRLAALMLFFLTSNVTGEAVIPDSPAGKALAAWLASFNSADAAQIRAFDEAYGYEPKPLDETIDWSEQTGGFTVLRIEKAEPLAIDAVSYTHL